MTQTQNRIFDELGRLFTNAAGRRRVYARKSKPCCVDRQNA